MLADHLLKPKKEYKKIKETGDSWYFCQSELGKACFQHDRNYSDFKDLPRRTASEVLHNKSIWYC